MVNWIYITPTSGNSGTTQITLTVSPNTDYSARTTNFTVRTRSKNLTETVTVNQAAQTATGQMTFNPSALSYTYEGGTIPFTFTANEDWRLISWPTWIGISGDAGTEGYGSAGTYTWGVTALQNSSQSDLDSTFTFYCGGNYFTVPVHQDAYNVQPSLSVSPTSVSDISSGGTSFNIAVTSNTGWTITSYPNWITFNSTSGSGNGSVYATVSSNSDSARTGNIVFMSNDSAITATVSVSQNAAEESGSTSEYLTFEILSGGTLNWHASYSSITRTIEYRINNGNWTSITSTTGGTSINVNSGDIVEWRGDNDSYGGRFGESSSFYGSTAQFKVYGNIMSLIDSTNFSGLTTLSSAYTFQNLFDSCTGLTDASKLLLPATTLASSCYSDMFMGCTSLTHAPSILPATTLAQNCYLYMFWGCTSLTTAPELPATTLANQCYYHMFYGCTGLTQAPELPATTLANSCYEGMFLNCRSLTTAPELPATTLANRCYQDMFQGCRSLTTAPELPATTLAGSCYTWMFAGCRSLTQAPELPATTLQSSCYAWMFEGCTGLTTAPELPATTLVENCYVRMFDGCTNLNYIKCLATNISAFDCTTNWVYSVAPTGTFVKADSMTGWTIDSADGVPIGWTLINESDETAYYSTQYLTFEIISGGTIKWQTNNTAYTKTIEYSKNGGNWTSITSTSGGTVINVNSGDIVEFRGDNPTYGTDLYLHRFSESTARFKVYGNIMSLINSTNFSGLTTLSSAYTFSDLFYNCSGLTDASKLVLPATTLTQYCYSGMFSNCTSLTKAPKLPATTLAQYCYYGMFFGCSSLTTAPELPATTLVDYCYDIMFRRCTRLNYIKCLATNISAEKCTFEFLDAVALTGTFVKNPNMNSWPSGNSGIPDGWTVVDAS